MDSFEIVLIMVAAVIWVIQKLVEGARKIRHSSLTPEERRKLKQERVEARRAMRQRKTPESVQFPASRLGITVPPPVPPALAPAPPAIVPAPPKRHPPRLELGAESKPLDRAEALQMIWQQAVEAEPAARPSRKYTQRRGVADAQIQLGHVEHEGFDQRALRRLLARPSTLRTAILAQEILGKPKALRGR